jgi:hypothetical protein
METCWCRGTKRELQNPAHFITASQAKADMEAFYRYVSAIDAMHEYGKDVDVGHQGHPREHPGPDQAREGD